MYRHDEKCAMEYTKKSDNEDRGCYSALSSSASSLLRLRRPLFQDLIEQRSHGVAQLSS